MKCIKQFLIIAAIAFVGEALSRVIPLPIPASIYGLILLFTGLITKIVPYESVKDTGHFLIEIMPVMFISPAVGLLDSWGVIKSSWLQYLITAIVTTAAVMAVSGLVTQKMVQRGGQEDE